MHQPMKKPLILFIAGFLIVAGVLVWWFSDKQVIKRQTVVLTDLFSMSSGDGKASRVSRNQNLAKLLDPEFSCSIDIENYQGEHGRDSLLEAHIYLGQVCESSSVQVGGIEFLSLTDDSTTVRAEFSISVRMKSGSNYSESSPVILEWQKNENGEWRLKEVILKSP